MTQEFLTILEQYLMKQAQFTKPKPKKVLNFSKPNCLWKCFVHTFTITIVKKQAVDQEGKGKVDAMAMRIKN